MEELVNDQEGGSNLIDPTVKKDIPSSRDAYPVEYHYHEFNNSDGKLHIFHQVEGSEYEAMLMHLIFNVHELRKAKNSTIIYKHWI